MIHREGLQPLLFYATIFSMTVKIALLKSGEDVIADWHELVAGDEDNVAAYLAKNPYVVKLNKTDISSPEAKAKVGVTYFPWMPLSKETDIPINPDWVVTLVDPVDQVKESYEDKVNDIKKRRDGYSPDNGD